MHGKLHTEAYLTVPDKHTMAEELAAVVRPRMNHVVLEAPARPPHFPELHAHHHSYPTDRIDRYGSQNVDRIAAIRLCSPLSA
ncbi:hypothetical protein Sjap_022160 [Stephania japonica]|uniref:Uncharacterized protein n=1 Tax=Stephania japonica TaxID=461633 RepID=A0AAP0EU20_9MAGN